MESDRSRYHLLDLIRIMAMFVIFSFHLNETIFFSDALPFPSDQTIYDELYSVFRYFGFTGLVVLTLSAYLYGERLPSPKAWLSLLGVIGLGVIVLAFINGGDSQLFFWEWDVYPFLLVSFATLMIAHRCEGLVYVLGFMGAIFLWIPFWKWAPPDQSFVTKALFGVCESGGGGWPILPWIGLSWMAFAIGRSRRRPAVKIWGAQISRVEAFVWFSALALSLFNLSGYADSPIGPSFGCYVFRRDPTVFWSVNAWVLFFIRISWIPEMNHWLSRWRLIRWVSNLKWSQNFGLCYLLQFPLIGLASLAFDEINRDARLFDLLVVIAMPTTEVAARLLLLARQRLNEWNLRLGPDE